MNAQQIELDNLTLKNFTPKDVTQDYINWLNDSEINKYLEVRHSLIDLSYQKEYVRQVNESDDCVLFGIVTKNGELIGSTKVGPINRIHGTTTIGIMIGSKEKHGLGYGSEVINGICNYVRDNFDIRKINAGAYSENISSLKVFYKCGFVVEGRRVKQLKGPDGLYHDEMLLGRVLIQ